MRSQWRATKLTTLVPNKKEKWLYLTLASAAGRYSRSVLLLLLLVVVAWETCTMLDFVVTVVVVVIVVVVVVVCGGRILS